MESEGVGGEKTHTDIHAHNQEGGREGGGDGARGRGRGGKGEVWGGGDSGRKL